MVEHALGGIRIIECGHLVSAAAIPGQGLGGGRRRAQGRSTPSSEAKRGAGHSQFSENGGLGSGTPQGEPRHVPEGRLGRRTSP
jgi:hypothetical protein